MTIREKPAGPRARGVPLAAALCLLSSACNSAPDQVQEIGSEHGNSKALKQAAESCLLVLWDERKPVDPGFDQRHDQVEGGAISCATGATPAEFDAVISALRTAARSRDREAVLEAIGIPMVYIDAEGVRREFADRAELEPVFEQVFDEATLAALEALDIADMAVTKDQGGSFKLGALWLAVPAPGEPPQLITVNRQALGEAAEAARRKAIAQSDKSLAERDVLPD